jgi:hypothetical protein
VGSRRFKMGTCQLREEPLTEEHRSSRIAAGWRKVCNPTQKNDLARNPNKESLISQRVVETMMMMMMMMMVMMIMIMIMMVVVMIMIMLMMMMMMTELERYVLLVEGITKTYISQTSMRYTLNLGDINKGVKTRFTWM